MVQAKTALVGADGVPCGQAVDEDGAAQRGAGGAADRLEEVERAGGGAQVAVLDRVLPGRSAT